MGKGTRSRYQRQDSVIGSPTPGMIQQPHRPNRPSSRSPIALLGSEATP